MKKDNFQQNLLFWLQVPFKDIKNKHDVYKGKGCMNKFCEYLREHTMKIINNNNCQ